MFVPTFPITDNKKENEVEGGGGGGGTGKIRGKLNIERSKHVLKYGVFWMNNKTINIYYLKSSEELGGCHWYTDPPRFEWYFKS